MARTIILAVCALTLLIAVQQAFAGKDKSSCVVFAVFVLKSLRSTTFVRTGVFVVCKLTPLRCGVKVATRELHMHCTHWALTSDH